MLWLILSYFFFFRKYPPVSYTHLDVYKRQVYVLVIGDTARACNFGLYGYERKTTPLLDKMEGLVTFTDVLTQSNTTHKSGPMLLSAASAEYYDCLYRQKGIITAFKEAGFHTAFFSNQLPNHSFIDFLGMEADAVSYTHLDVYKRQKLHSVLSYNV